MAFSPKELEIIKYGASNGKSRQEVEDALTRLRTGLGPKPQPVETPEEQGVVATIKDIPNDIGEAFKGSVDAITRGFETADQVRTKVEEGQVSPIAGTVKTIGSGLRAGAEVIGQGFLGLGKLLTSPFREKAIAGGVETGAQEIAQSEPVRALIDRYQSLPEEQKAVVDGVLGTTEGLGTMFGLGPATKVLKQGVSEVASGTTKVAREAADIVSKTARGIIPPTTESIGGVARGAYSKAKSWLQESVPPSVETVLKETPTGEFDRYVSIGRQAATSNKNITPLEFAGRRAQEALDQVNRKLKTIGQNKSAIVQSSVGRSLVGNIVVQFRQGLQRALSNKTSVEGDSKVFRDVLAESERLGDNPSAQQVDRFIDFVQDRIYTSKRDLTIPVTDDVEATLRPITGKLNEALKQKLPESYRTLNQQYADLVGIRNELNVKLGAEGERGGALMKRVFSPSDANTKQLFADVLDVTGIDLVNEATLARYVMDVLGDARQKSMLQQLNLLTTKPTTGGVANRIVDWIYEQANTPEALIERARALTQNTTPL